MSKKSEAYQRLMENNGIGALIALAIVAAVGNAKQFMNGHSMSANFGLVPYEHSSAGSKTFLAFK